MNRLFLNFSIRILIALIVSVVTAYQGIRLIGSDQYYAEKAQAHLRQIYYVEDRLSRIPENAISKELERLRHTFPQLEERINVRRATSSLPRDVVVSGADQSKIFFGSTEKGIMIYKRIRQGAYFLIYGPIHTALPLTPAVLITAFFIILTIVAAAGYMLARPVAISLKALEDAAMSFGKGNLDARVKISSIDQIGELAVGFNQMAERIQRLINDQKYLLQAVSHEFRQPLSRMRFNLELLYKAEDQQAREQRIAKMERGFGELEELVKELMLYMHMETDLNVPEKKSLSLGTVLPELVDERRSLRPEIDVTIQSDPDNDIHLDASEIHFRRAIGNLISNAVMAAKSEVTLDVSRNDRGINIGITDDGDGIPPPDRERVFKPFVRLDDSRSRDLGGVGLGLAIVYRILELHGGIVEIVDTEGKGARFITIWPSA